MPDGPRYTILFKTHHFARGVLERMYELRNALKTRDDMHLVICCDESSGAITRDIKAWVSDRFDAFFFGGVERHRELGFPLAEPVANGSANPNWFHGEYFVLEYMARHGCASEYIWILEFDVYLAQGDWVDFFGLESTHDLLTCSLRSEAPLDPANGVVQDWPVDRGWEVWKWYNGPSPKLGCFFPTLRLSRPLIDSLTDSFSRDRIGYCEVRVPSVAHEYGHSIISMADATSNLDLRVMHPHWNPVFKKNPFFDVAINRL